MDPEHPEHALVLLAMEPAPDVGAVEKVAAPIASWIPPGPRAPTRSPNRTQAAPKRSHDVPRTMTIAQERHAGLGRPMDALGVLRLIN